MGFIDKIIGVAGGSAIGAVGNIVESVFDNKQQKLSHEEVMAKLAMAPQTMQVELNKIEASHRSIFVAGWRPFIGWVCGAGLAFTFLANPLIQWFTDAPGPDLPLDDMMSLVIALLGLGGLRTVEKIQGRAK